MAEKAEGPATPKQLLSVLQDESPSAQYRKRNSLLKDMRNDVFSEFNRLAEEEEKREDAPTPSACVLDEEEEEDDYDESDGDEDDENCYWSDDDVEQRRPATARRRTASRAPKVAPVKDSATTGAPEASPSADTAPIADGKKVSSEGKDDSAPPASADEGATKDSAPSDTPAPLETSDSYKDTELFRQLEELKLRRAAAEEAASSAGTASSAGDSTKVEDVTPKEEEKKAAPPEAAVAREKSTPPMERRVSEEAGRPDLATVARTPSTFGTRPESRSASLDRPPREELSTPATPASLEQELELEIEKEIEKIVAEETESLPSEQQSSSAAEEKKEGKGKSRDEKPTRKFTVKEPRKTGTGSTVKFSKSKHSRAGSDVHKSTHKKSHRRSRSTGKVHLQVIADATRQQHSDDMKKCVDDSALTKPSKPKLKRVASEKKSAKHSLKDGSSEKKSSKSRTKEKSRHGEEKSKHAEEKSKSGEEKREKSHKTKKDRAVDQEKPKHKTKELLTVDAKADRRAKRSSRTIDAARSLAHKTQQLLGKKDTPDSSQESIGTSIQEEELASAAEAMAAIEAARLAVHKELTSSDSAEGAGKKELEKTSSKQEAKESKSTSATEDEESVSKPESELSGAEPHFLQPRDRSFTQELAIEGAPVVPGADYFLTDSDRALIKEMEEKEARRVAMQKPVAEGEDGKAKKTLGTSQTRAKFRSLLKNLQSEGEEEVEDARAKLLQLQHEHQQVLEAKKAAIALAEDEELSFKERMRNKTINEVMFSEVDYVDDLSFIITMFHDNMLERGLVTEQQRVAIFSNIDLIFDMHTNLLEKLGKWAQHPDGPEVADCFAELTQYRKLFSDYCNNHANAVHTVESLMRKSAAFRQLVEEQQAHPRCNGMPFTSFLIKPVQRICKYPLFLRELIKHTEESNAEYGKLVVVLENFNSVVELINETKRAADNMAAITHLQRKLGVKALELLQPGRVFVREGFLQETIKGEPAMLLYCLFNDILLRAEKKVKKFGTIRKQEKFTLADQLPIYSVSVHTEGTQGFTVECGKKSYRVTAGSTAERDSWVEAIRAQQKTMFDESNTEHNDPTRTSASALSPLPAAAPAEAQMPAKGTRKVKCYLHKGAANQRIRKVVLNPASSTSELLSTIRKEFEWEEDRKLTVGYLDDDDDLVEISSSINMDEVCNEAKLLQILDSEE